MPRHGGWQAVKGGIELRLGQLACNGVDRVDGPALFTEKARQRTAGEEAQVRAVEQAFFAVEELPFQQFSDKAGVARIGHRYEQPPLGLEQLAACGQHLFWAAQVFQHIGAHDEVIVAACKGGNQVARLQVVHHHAPVVGSRMGGLGFAQGHAVQRAAACFRQMLPQCAAAATQVQHRGLVVHQACQYR